jgi:hypothetical protein
MHLKTVRGATYPEIISSIYIPLDHVPIPFWEVRLKAVFFADPRALFVARFLVLFIMTMCRIELMGRA